MRKWFFIMLKIDIHCRRLSVLLNVKYPTNFFMISDTFDVLICFSWLIFFRFLNGVCVRFGFINFAIERINLPTQIAYADNTAFTATFLDPSFCLNHDSFHVFLSLNFAWWHQQNFSTNVSSWSQNECLVCDIIRLACLNKLKKTD